MGERGAVKTHLHSRLNLPSVRVVLWAFRRATKRQDRDRPEIVSLNAKSKPVLDHAQQLGRDGREDAQAVAELRALASNGRRTLRQAQRASRFGGYHHELRQANLAHRLLEAAVTRNPVAAITPEDQKRLETVEAFDSLSLSEQWAGLTIRQPLLIELEADVQAGRAGEAGRIVSSPVRQSVCQTFAACCGSLHPYCGSSERGTGPPARPETRPKHARFGSHSGGFEPGRPLTRPNGFQDCTDSPQPP